ncbi:iron uptake transporter deferrochelatase/peroxidase subunit [Saxibacter everestensis]|uniref:Deferrochelatase n=1 Tax=Saxibacter everestensis TaxID=2909229 RepID=A0ABY8QVD8_9MICO|nr:iron uptake transporter deferrochelatase/peroxidase subunit [Brevibacteriaceae bacterium ZFBP1038]
MASPTDPEKPEKPEKPATPAKPAKLRLSRRALFGLGGASVAGAAIGVGAMAAYEEFNGGSGTTYPFYGEHQAGIVTPAQDRLHFAAFDVLDVSRDELIELLQDWTVAAANMTAGQDIGRHGAVGGPQSAPPEDTGEALGLPAAGLTITFGFGRSLFRTKDGDDRFGLGRRMPDALEPIPPFAIDSLSEASSDGDLCVQACADDPQIAVHAIRNLSRIAFGRASIRWSQLGFGRTSSTSKSQTTPRNLFGFKDGTASIKSEDAGTVNKWVWAKGSGSEAWMNGGSYLVARKIRMIIETWDRQSLQEQERVFGRSKGEGGPLSGGKEFDEPDFAAPGTGGNPMIDVAAHVRLAHPKQNSGIQLLRRGYNYVDGNDELGRLNAGLFFISFQSDHRTGFSAIQANLRRDAMNEYVRHVSSGLFAVPPGISDGGFIGQRLFAD